MRLPFGTVNVVPWRDRSKVDDTPNKRSPYQLFDFALSASSAANKNVLMDQIQEDIVCGVGGNGNMCPTIIAELRFVEIASVIPLILQLLNMLLKHQI
jgi:hypothetical protein